MTNDSRMVRHHEVTEALDSMLGARPASVVWLMLRETVFPNALNSTSQCPAFAAGVNRHDFDLPPGRIDIVLVPHDGPIHATPILLVDSSAVSGTSASVTVTGRAERSFAALPYGGTMCGQRRWSMTEISPL